MENGGHLPATRSDLEGLRTEIKTDIQGLRVETGRMDAKIDSSFRRLAIEIIDVRTELRELKSVVATKSDIKRLVDTVEGFAGKSQKYDAATVLHGQALTDVQIQMKDHERRIKGLEDRPH
jgi:hypothetical protein